MQHRPGAARAKDRVVFFVGPTMAPSARARALRGDPRASAGQAPRRGEAHRGGARAWRAGDRRRRLPRQARRRPRRDPRRDRRGLGGVGAVVDGRDPRARDGTARDARLRARVRALQAEADFQDDEVALLHEATAPYRAGDRAARAPTGGRSSTSSSGGSSPDTDATAVVADLKSRWFGERTVRGTIEALARARRGGGRRSGEELRDFRRFALKTLISNVSSEQPPCDLKKEEETP